MATRPFAGCWWTSRTGGSRGCVATLTIRTAGASFASAATRRGRSSATRAGSSIRSGAWQRTSWEDALDLIAERARAAGPAAVGTWSGHGFFANNYGTRLGSELLRRFSNLYGCQWWSPSMICWGLGGFGLGLTGALRVNTKEDMGANSALVILWGANLASQPNTGRYLAEARRRGAGVVTVDVRRTEASAQSDETVLLKPGN